MSFAYKVGDSSVPHFITFTVQGWIGMFTRKEWCIDLINSLKHCQEYKGLIIHAWVIMPNHLHMIISSQESHLSEILRDFKKFTSKHFKRELLNASFESRRYWLWEYFLSKNGNNWRFWKEGFHPIELKYNFIKDQKLDYIHQNPVKAMIVKDAESFCWSSAIDYSGNKGLLDIDFL